MEGNSQVLEINLISAQELKPPSANVRRLQTYAVVWVNPSAKLRTKVDEVGGENPTWNDKFLFRVSPNFIASDTSAVNIEIYAVGYVKTLLIGTVRFLFSDFLARISASADAIGTPECTAVQIRRPSGRFRGILNIAAAAYNSADFPLLKGSSAICFRDLMGETENGKESASRQRRLSRGGSRKTEERSSGHWSFDFDQLSLDSSDGTESTSSSSSPAPSTALKEWNVVKKGMAGKMKSSGGGLLCGLMLQRKIPSGPLDQDVPYRDESLNDDKIR